MARWHPIATAPREGSEIEVADSQSTGRTRWIRNPEDEAACGGDWQDCGFEPLMWRPIKTYPEEVTSEYIGVHWVHVREKWRAIFKTKKGQIRLIDYFDSFDEAVAAYKEAAE